jgi:hypothetical protein
MKRTYSDRFSWGTLDVDYDYQPREPMTWTYSGCAESIEITRIWFCPRESTSAMVDLTPLLNEEMFSVEALAAMEERILESMEQASPDEE